MLFANYQLSHALPKQLEKKTLALASSIVSLPKEKKGNTSFLFKSRNKLYKVSCYRCAYHFNAGEKWKLFVRLKRPHGFSDPGVFDYEKYLFQNGINGVGYIVNRMPNKMISNSSWHHPILHLRSLIKKKIMSRFKQDPLVGLLPALVIGDRHEVSQQQWDVLRKTGTNHLIAIAGLHIGLITGLVYFLFGWLWRRSSKLPLIMPAQIASAYVSFITAIFYSLLAGFSIQTQRALIMLSVVMISLVLKRVQSTWHSFFLALFIVLLINPLNVLSMGFWMSFSAVAIILFCMNGRLKPRGLWWKWGRVQWVIMLGIMPFSLLFFHETSLIGILANTIAVPWVGFVILPLCFFGVITLFFSQAVSYFLFSVSLVNLKYLWMVLSYLAALPKVSLNYFLPNWILFLFLICAILIFLLPKGFKGKYLSFFLLLPLMTFHYPKPEQGNFWFTLLDVGQGLASVIQTQHHVLIYDTGPDFGDSFDAGQAVVIPYLQSQGVKKVDLMMISHGDDDHIGGAKSILKVIPIKKILTSVPERFKHYSALHCYQGEHWQWDGVRFRVLSPIKGERYEGNNSSCVLKISNGNKSLLLTGDMQKRVEERLVQNNVDIQSTVLVAPHHGSDTSSSIPFVQAVNPKYVLFPVGYLNKFHFPKRDVVKRYQNIDAALLDTVHDGAITIRFDKKPIKPELYRVEHQRVWNL